MGRVFLLAASILFASAAANAGDMPYPEPSPPQTYQQVSPPYNWTGFYVGGNGGYGFANDNSTVSIVGGLLNGTGATGSNQLSGGVAGGQIGVNYQFNSFVVGAEGDFDWSGQSKTGSVGILNSNASFPYIGTLRTRIGFAIDRMLLYATGGVALTNASATITAPVGTIFSSTSSNVGWPVGAGAEFALAQNWTVRAEYLYIGTRVKLSGGIAILGGIATDTITVSDNIVRAGVNFKFP